jgi:serine/threonine protein kinase
MEPADIEKLDAVGFSQLVMQLGLLSEAKLVEAREEAGTKELNPFVRLLERKSLLTPWQVDHIFKGYTEGFFLGGYLVLYKIASGSFGRVFRAADPHSERGLAIKVLRRRWTEDAHQVDLFMREGRVGLTLKHPNIVEVIAVGQDTASGQYYLVMEFVEGDNLRNILGVRKTLSVAESLRITEDATSGLAYAHSRGVTHRDVKLSNLLISTTGETKIVDFGLAGLYAASGEKVKVDRTVDYAGLEKATNVKPGDIRSDIYFLGCILYECLTGRSPLVMTRDKRARMRRDRFEEVRPMHPADVQAPGSVFSLVETMMSLAPNLRYQTPAQLLEGVRAARRDVEGRNAPDRQPRGRSVFVIEGDPRRQDALRDRFREMGFRVFLAADPVRASDRFRQQPFDALVVDAVTAGEEGVLVMEHIMSEASRREHPLAAVVLLSEEQKKWAERVRRSPGAAPLTYPVSFKQLRHALEGMLAPLSPADNHQRKDTATMADDQ